MSYAENSFLQKSDLKFGFMIDEFMLGATIAPRQYYDWLLLHVSVNERRIPYFIVIIFYRNSCIYGNFNALKIA